MWHGRFSPATLQATQQLGRSACALQLGNGQARALRLHIMSPSPSHMVRTVGGIPPPLEPSRTLTSADSFIISRSRRFPAGGWTESRGRKRRPREPGHKRKTCPGLIPLDAARIESVMRKNRSLSDRAPRRRPAGRVRDQGPARDPTIEPALRSGAASGAIPARCPRPGPTCERCSPIASARSLPGAFAARFGMDSARRSLSVPDPRRDPST